MNQPSLSYPCYSRPPRESASHADLLEMYKIHLVRERGLSRPRNQLQVATCFLLLLEDCRCNLNDVSITHIQTFIIEQGRYYQRRTIASIASALKVFLRYLAFHRLVHRDLSESVRRPRVFRGEREPRYLQDWQVRHVLNSVDQSTAKGKRDYALLLLLAVYGLRAGEIVGLRLEDCRWVAGKLLIRERKCGDAMELPLTAEVAEALVTYLRVRPETKEREIFLNVFRPHPPLRTGGLHIIARKAIHICGFDVAHPGTHTFRYSHAQALFAAQRPLSEIAGALGHRDMSTTLGYLSFTVHPLRELALGAGEELA